MDVEEWHGDEEKADQASSPSLGQVCWWQSSVGGVLVPTQLGPKKKQILLFAPRACGAVPALFLQGLGGGPWPIILYSPLCLSHKENYTNKVFQKACFTYTLTAWCCYCVRLLSTECQVCSGYAFESNRDLWKTTGTHKKFAFKIQRFVYIFNCLRCLFKNIYISMITVFPSIFLPNRRLIMKPLNVEMLNKKNAWNY